MDICIDIQPAVSQRAGIGRYTRELATHLDAFVGAGDALRLFFFDFRGRSEPVPVRQARLQRVRGCPGRAAQWAWKRLRWPPFDWFSGPADLFHFTNFILPPLRRGRAVVSIHDASFLRYPEFAEERNLAYLRAGIRDTVARADAILTLSAFSASELRETLGVEAGRLHPIPLAVPDGFAAPPQAAVRRVLDRLGLRQPYLLTVGTLEPRKNHVFLAEVFEALGDFRGTLVVAGMPGWKCEPILARLRGSPRAADIRYLAYADDADLPALYAGAAAFVLPSHYEGFGLPPLEAMACGAPVVSSRGGSLPEVLGDAAEFVGAFDTDAWCAAIRAVIEDGPRRRELIQRGRRRAAGFTWEETARRTWDVYRRVCGGPATART